MASKDSVVMQYIKQPWRLAVPLKRLLFFFVFLGLVTTSSLWAFKNLKSAEYVTVSLIVLWLVVAYYALPRIHRVLSRFYLPEYFIGRARTSDGLLADPVNLALRGSRENLVKAMNKAGWSEADPITLRTGLKIVTSTIRKRSYPNAPVSDLFVYGRKHDLAFQKEVDGNPAKRHHVRFWHVDEGAYLPGGYNVDWVAAATYDDAVGFSLFTLQITHSIDGDVDAERDFLVGTIKKAHRAKKIERIDFFFPQYRDRNGGGHKYFTDGSMVIVDLKKGLLR